MPEQPNELHRFAHEAMVTVWEVIIEGEDATYARQASQAVFAEVDRLEGLLSRFNPSSDLSQVNRLLPGQSMKVTLDLLECLKTAMEIHERTGGAFDITVGSLMGYLRDHRGRPLAITEEQRAEALSRVGMKRLELDDRTFTVTIKPAPGRDQGGRIALDLGAIGKGYALDRAAEIFKEWGIESALLHAGKSTALALGSRVNPTGRAGWVVGAGAEWDQEAGFGTVRLYNEALSGSGKQVRGEHILDPRTGFPARRHLAAWAIAPSAAVSDALSTAFVVMSTAEVMSLCQSMRDVAGLVVVRRKGIRGAFQEESIASPGFREHSQVARATDS